MAHGVEAWVRRWWQGRAGWAGRMASLGFLPAEWCFRWAVWGRNRLFDTRVLPAGRASIPVISVGNLTVGGTGKTPMVRWFVDALTKAGGAPAVVARGYGRDELLLHRRWHPGVPVVAHPDRCEAVARAVDRGADVAVVDDGFQHRRLMRDLDVVLIAAETPFPGRHLPRGPYREGPAALARAQLVIVTRKTAPPWRAQAVADQIRKQHPGLALARAALTPAAWQSLDGSPGTAPDGIPLVVTSVAEPASVRDLAARRLARPGDDVELEAFPDHHEFSVDEVRAVVARRRPLVITEKDAVKLVGRRDELAGTAVHVLALGLDWDEGREHADAVVERALALRARGRLP